MITSITKKEYQAQILGRSVTLYNQHSSDWTHLYNHPVDPLDTLKSAGCGIFSICHAAQWMTGFLPDAESLADFSINNGGRMYDGTDRPALLTAMQACGMAAEFGFSYSGTGPENGAEKLFNHIKSGGTALCNLRVGHIVCLVAARTESNLKQFLAIDSHPTAKSDSQYESIREALDTAVVVYETVNKYGAVTGIARQSSAFWVDWQAPFNYDLLYPIHNKNEA